MKRQASQPALKALSAGHHTGLDIKFHPSPVLIHMQIPVRDAPGGQCINRGAAPGVEARPGHSTSIHGSDWQSYLRWVGDLSELVCPSSLTDLITPVGSTKTRARSPPSVMSGFHPRFP